MGKKRIQHITDVEDLAEIEESLNHPSPFLDRQNPRDKVTVESTQIIHFRNSSNFLELL